MVVLRPAKAGSSSRLRKFRSPTIARNSVGRPADVHDEAVLVETGAEEFDVSDVGGPVQPLRGAEHLAA